MDEAFIIMQIGDTEMDNVCDQVLQPAIEACGLLPRRVDRDNSGDLLKAEIVAFLEGANIIVADLTNERPNCYLEVGYAMGLGKKRNLILTVKEDHHHRSKNYKSDGPRVHFDLEGYDLLLWDPDDLASFRAELEKRIKRRLAILEPSSAVEPSPALQGGIPVVDTEWIEAQRERARIGLESVGLSGYMEAEVSLSPPGSWRQSDLMTTIEASQIKTFGWPIAVVLARDNFRPQPTAEGVRAEVAFKEGESSLGEPTYDYWYMRQSGDFYLYQSLFEDARTPQSIFFDTRIVRVTELLLFLSRCYTRLEVADDTRVRIEVSYGGLKDRTLRAASQRRLMSIGRSTQEDRVSSVIECTVGQLQTDLVTNVRKLLEPLFMVFNFSELGDQIWDQVINDFVAGKIV